MADLISHDKLMLPVSVSIASGRGIDLQGWACHDALINRQKGICTQQGPWVSAIPAHRDVQITEVGTLQHTPSCMSALVCMPNSADPIMEACSLEMQRGRQGCATG